MLRISSHNLVICPHNISIFIQIKVKFTFHTPHLTFQIKPRFESRFSLIKTIFSFCSSAQTAYIYIIQIFIIYFVTTFHINQAFSHDYLFSYLTCRSTSIKLKQIKKVSFDKN